MTTQPSLNSGAMLSPKTWSAKGSFEAQLLMSAVDLVELVDQVVQRSGFHAVEDIRNLSWQPGQRALAHLLADFQ